MHGCERAPEVCAAQTGHVHVPESVALVCAFAVLLVAVRLVRG